MRTPLLRHVAALTLCAGLSAGCKEDTPSEPAAPVPESAPAWPAEPEDGSGVTIEFVKMIGEGDRRGAQLRIYNHAIRIVRQLDMWLRYLDASGAEVGTHAHRLVAPKLVPGRAWITTPAGALVPEQTARVEGVVRRVEREDGSVWVRPGDHVQSPETPLTPKSVIGPPAR